MTSRQFTTSRVMERRASEDAAKKGFPSRKMGLLVPEKERNIVDGLIYLAPERGMRRLALSVVTSLRRGHDNFSCEEYFSAFAAELLKFGILEREAVDRIMSMPMSQRGNAFRVALERKASDRSQYSQLGFYGDLICDMRENVPGEKQEEILARMAEHVRRAQAKGMFNRESYTSLLYPFEEWLRQADIRSVNLLYYFSDRLDGIMEAALGLQPAEFRELLREGLPRIAEFDPLNGGIPGMRAHYLGYVPGRLRADTAMNGGAAGA